MQDAVAEEMAYVLSHAGVRFAVVQDQEQVDKIQSMADRHPGTDRSSSTIEPRGLRDYDHTHLHDFPMCRRRAGQRRRTIQNGHFRLGGGNLGVGRQRDFGNPLHVRHDRPFEGRDADGAASVKAAEDTAKFDNMTENDEVLAYLPLAWVGDHYLNYAQGYAVGLCMSCPESPETVRKTCARSGRPSISRRRGSSRAC
jgi:long-chain acyl-CoA synthetase